MSYRFKLLIPKLPYLCDITIISYYKGALHIGNAPY